MRDYNNNQKRIFDRALEKADIGDVSINFAETTGLYDRNYGWKEFTEEEAVKRIEEVAEDLQQTAGEEV